MPIKIVNSTYTDIFGNTLGFYQANAGDKVTATITIESNISITEVAGLSVDINWMDDEFNLLGANSWLSEGFRVGDTVDMEIWQKSTDTLYGTSTYTIDYVSDTVLRPSGSIGGIFDHNAYWLRFKVTNRQHSDLEVNLNHMLNNTNNSTLASLIDGEITAIKFLDLDGMAVNDVLNGVLIGNQSGQYLIDGEITRETDAHNSRVYTLVLNFIQSGVYDSEWFDLGNCLKLATRYKFYSLPNEISNVTIIDNSFTANTGYFNTPYNSGVSNSTLITPIAGSIDYAVPTTVEFIIESHSSELYLGAQYVSIDTDYYKNQTANQNELGLLLDAYVPLAVGTYLDTTGQYMIDVNSIDIDWLTYTINITITPLAGFETLFDSFDEGDRLFYIWCKAGTVNHLVYADQLEKAFEAVLPLNPRYFTLNRHDNNTEVGTQTNEVTKTNIEDDLFIYSVFQIDANTIYTGLRCSILAYNSVTLDEFTLESVFFDFSTLQINSSGQYLIDMEQQVLNNLQSTSAKKVTTLSNDLTTDRGTLYYPFVNRWEYWLSQTNANADFYPNQNKNWLNFINGDWSVICRISLETEDVAYQSDLDIPISDYDTETRIQPTIEFYREGDDPFTDSPVTALFSGEIMTIKAIHGYNGYTAESSWGEITIETFEGQPRWNSSTEVAYDNNPNNPLSPITGTVITTTTSLSETVLTCSLDVDKLTDLDFKFTSKIFLSVVTVTGLIFQHDEPVVTQSVEYLKPQFQL